MSDRKAVLVGGGQVERADLLRAAAGAECLIGVDGGALALAEAGLKPDWLIGDFDSLSGEDLARLEAAGARVRRFSREKDETDMELALRLAQELDMGNIVILGATGSRLDHTLTNLGLLRLAVELGLNAAIVAPGQEIRLLGPGRTVLRGRSGQVVSLIPLTPVAGNIVTHGLRYPLSGEDLLLGRSRGVHNEFCGVEAEIILAAGELLVFIFASGPAP